MKQSLHQNIMLYDLLVDLLVLDFYTGGSSYDGMSGGFVSQGQTSLMDDYYGDLSSYGPVKGVWIRELLIGRDGLGNQMRS